MEIRLTPSRIIPAVAVFAAALYFGVFARYYLSSLQSAHLGYKALFAVGFGYLGLGLACFICSSWMDVALRAGAAWRQRLRRAIVVLVHGQTDCGPFRVISLQSGNEMARFTTAEDAFAWADGSPVLNPPQGARYEVHNMAGDTIGHPKRSDPCKCSA